VTTLTYLTHDVSNRVGSDLLHVDDGGHAGFDLDFIQLPVGAPIVFKNIGPIAISISFLCRRWRSKYSFKSLL
jgi:hypothetical protein